MRYLVKADLFYGLWKCFAPLVVGDGSGKARCCNCCVHLHVACAHMYAHIPSCLPMLACICTSRAPICTHTYPAVYPCSCVRKQDCPPACTCTFICMCGWTSMQVHELTYVHVCRFTRIVHVHVHVHVHVCMNLGMT